MLGWDFSPFPLIEWNKQLKLFSCLFRLALPVLEILFRNLNLKSVRKVNVTSRHCVWPHILVGEPRNQSDPNDDLLSCLISLFPLSWPLCGFSLLIQFPRYSHECSPAIVSISHLSAFLPRSELCAHVWARRGCYLNVSVNFLRLSHRSQSAVATANTHMRR